MINAYDARIAWTCAGLGDDSDYPGKVRAMAAFWADHVSLKSFRALRFRGFAALLADLLSADMIAAALNAVLWVLRLRHVVVTVRITPDVWPPAWSVRPADRLPSRRPTGPPRACPLPSATGRARVLISP